MTKNGPLLTFNIWLHGKWLGVVQAYTRKAARHRAKAEHGVEVHVEQVA